jgi:hypothetical protein
MMVKRYPNLKEEIGSSIRGCESPPYLTNYLPSGELPRVLWRWHVSLLSQKQKKKEKRKKKILYHLSNTIYGL